MSGDVEFPEPSQEERALQSEQVNLLRQQSKLLADAAKQQSLLAPLLFETAGIRPIKDEAGETIGYELIEDSLAGTRREIEKGFLERSRAALAGELPVDPALIREVGEGEQTLRETLFKQLGPGYETSSPGIESLANFSKRKLELFDAARRGDLTLAEGLGLARESSQQGRIDTTLARTLGLNQSSLPFAQGFGSASYGYQNPIAALRAEREAKFNASIANMQQPGFGAVLGPAAYLGGMLATAPASSPFGRLFR